MTSHDPLQPSQPPDGAWLDAARRLTRAQITSRVAWAAGLLGLAAAQAGAVFALIGTGRTGVIAVLTVAVVETLVAAGVPLADLWEEYLLRTDAQAQQRHDRHREAGGRPPHLVVDAPDRPAPPPPVPPTSERSTTRP